MLSSCLISAELAADGHHVIMMARGDLEAAANSLRDLTNEMRHTEPRGCLKTEVSWALVVQLANSFGPARDSQDPRQPVGTRVGVEMGPKLLAWVGAEAERRSTLPELTPDPLPFEAGTPRPYQEEGARLIAATGRAFLFDEMGTGKTITTLLGLNELRAQSRLDGPVLVVCPASVVDPWVKEAAKWTYFKPVAYRGTKVERNRLLRSGDLLVTSYGVATNDAASALRSLGPQAIVVDELHYLKDPDAKRSKALRALMPEAEFLIALSGTPITHNSGDLWPSLYGLDPIAFPSRERFVRRYLWDNNKLNGANEPEFRRCLKGQQRRVAKADVLSQLPPKVYATRYVELPPKAREAYDEMESELTAQVEGGEITAMGALAQLTRLNQLAAATADVSVETKVDKDGEETQEVHVKLKAPSWKVDEMMAVLDERGGPGSGKQTTIWAPSKQLIMIAGRKAKAAGYTVGYIVGGQKQEERTAQVAAFQAGELQLMFATTAAGGVGLTLTAADAVIFLQRPWSFVEASQAEDRQHRIGSEVHDVIEVIDIVAKSTVDEKVRHVLAGKAGALAELLEDSRIALQCLGGHR